MPTLLLEPLTLAYLACLCATLLTLVLALSLRTAPQLPGVRLWVIGAGCCVLGIALNPTVPPLLWPGFRAISSSLQVLGLALLWLGMRRFRGVGGGRSWVLVGSLMFALLQLLWVFVTPQPGWRYLSLSLFGGAYIGLMVLELAGVPDGAGRREQRVLTVALLLALLVLAYRAIVVLFVTVPVASVDAGPPPFNSYALLGFSILLIVMLLCLQSWIVARVIDEAEISSQQDYLTGVLNRHGLLEQARRISADLRGQRAFALRIDVNRLSAINHVAGQRAGDVLLRVAAHTAKALLPAGSALGRWAGDEFVAFIPGIAAAQRFEVEYPRVVRRELMRLPDLPGGVLERLGLHEDIVKIRSVEYQGSLDALLELATRD
jgi:GGDEF domain-containing protein